MSARVLHKLLKIEEFFSTKVAFTIRSVVPFCLHGQIVFRVTPVLALIAVMGLQPFIRGVSRLHVTLKIFGTRETLATKFARIIFPIFMHNSDVGS